MLTQKPDPPGEPTNSVESFESILARLYGAQFNSEYDGVEDFLEAAFYVEKHGPSPHVDEVVILEAARRHRRWILTLLNKYSPSEQITRELFVRRLVRAFARADWIASVTLVPTIAEAYANHAPDLDDGPIVGDWECLPKDERDHPRIVMERWEKKFIVAAEGNIGKSKGSRPEAQVRRFYELLSINRQKYKAGKGPKHFRQLTVNQVAEELNVSPWTVAKNVKKRTKSGRIKRRNVKR